MALIAALNRAARWCTHGAHAFATGIALLALGVSTLAIAPGHRIAEHPAAGGVFHALRALAECRRWREVAPEAEPEVVERRWPANLPRSRAPCAIAAPARPWD